MQPGFCGGWRSYHLLLSSDGENYCFYIPLQVGCKINGKTHEFQRSRGARLAFPEQVPYLPISMLCEVDKNHNSAARVDPVHTG